MCGIVGAIAQRDVVDILVKGLRCLEYRGYDSAGVAVVNQAHQLQRIRCLGKVQQLAEKIKTKPISGTIGIAHTRWATHGIPSEENAHPHISGKFSVVHNGIIENYEELRTALQNKGYVFLSQTDTEVIVHLVEWEMRTASTLLQAVQHTVKQLKGAYGMVVMDRENPHHLIVARSGSPLVIGLGKGENFLASDQIALSHLTQRFIFLEEGDVAEVASHSVEIYAQDGQKVQREIHITQQNYDIAEKGNYRHFMQKEIFEQPKALIDTIEGRIHQYSVIPESIGNGAKQLLSQVEHIQIVACGTSFNAGLVSRYWLEAISGVSCDVEIASEFRYRQSVTRKNSLLITLSQSGETADTLAALKLAKQHGYLGTLTICNVASSSLVRESDFAFMTRAGVEIGVASTKAFTTQLTALLLLTCTLGRLKNTLSKEKEREILTALQALPDQMVQALSFNSQIEALAKDFAQKHHTLFLGRGELYPIAMEGALKLKEISYIHAEAYAAGELKHGPLALIDEDMPIIVLAPTNDLFEKIKSNIEEVRARGGKLYIFTDENAKLTECENVKIIRLASIHQTISPIIYTILLQLLAYHVALIKGTNVDQPRNLAKSVTVE